MSLACHSGLTACYGLLIHCASDARCIPQPLLFQNLTSPLDTGKLSPMAVSPAVPGLQRTVTTGLLNDAEVPSPVHEKVSLQ